ncbi:restriction endonuclease subunit S [Acinetobacter baumannii]|uniref:restriction endonuclease subunit S n=1 Tax=Acinetobacter baumannii TaxID=470 RepID=UPI0003D24624|nr:restriction endonuclease subunit S [Acinetobacter baumannii]AHB92362.1 EcoKI restriction-modification system protein HsdS [Acinetobacter baumannii ZW85-1]MDC4637159.1 restriction endonuclease subunit S [Acinetobacter baumannii]HEO1767126.1 restriction endonuclease subunit S [Acinetobacter baumannii]
MSQFELPEGWFNATIQDVAEVKGGKRLPKGKALTDQKTAHAYIRVTDMNNGSIDQSDIRYIDEETYKEISNYFISKDDLYISIAGTIGLVGDIPNELDGANLTENAAKICSLMGVEKHYLKYVLNSLIAKEQFEDKVTSSGQPKLALFRIRDCKFPLPPLAEQQVIADKLDTLLAQVESIKARLERIPEILKQLRQSVLAAAVSGKLTEEWREEEQLANWATTTLDSLILESANGLSKRTGVSGDEVTILRLADFKDAVRVHGNERVIKLDEKEKKKYALEKGDILIIRVNGSVDLAGRFIEYTQYDKMEGFCDHFIRIRLDTSRVNSTYLTYVANHGDGRHYLKNSLSTSAGQNTINQGSIKGLKLLLPSIQEQELVVSRVSDLFKYTVVIEEQVQSALDRVNNLTQSILAKAFRGELTAEWREANPELISGENSAEALLERIKAERSAKSVTKRGRGKA